jgi:nucleotide-binding universal stress UspA family protein
MVCKSLCELRDFVRILMGIDGSVATVKAIRFVGDLFGKANSKDIWITLLHVTESIPDENLEPGIPQSLGTAYQHVIDDAKARRKELGKNLLDKEVATLEAAGIPRDHIAAKLEVSSARPESSKVAAALGIINEMQRGNYDVVCIGRRGTTAAEGVFLTSTAEKVLRESRGRTVWVVD